VVRPSPLATSEAAGRADVAPLVVGIVGLDNYQVLGAFTAT
jgi:hypothetical protein